MFDWVRNLLTKKPKWPRDPSALLGPGNDGPLSYAFAGSSLSDQAAQVLAYKAWTYVAVDTRAKELAKTPPNVSYVLRDAAADPETSRLARVLRHYGHLPKERALTPLQAHEQLEPVGYDHPLCRLLDDPNDWDTSYDLWYETSMFKDLTGVAYWWLTGWNGFGLPTALWVIPSHWVWPVQGRGKLIEYYDVRPTEGHYAGRRIPADEVIAFRSKNPVSKLAPKSPLDAGAAWVDVNDSVWRARWWTYKNGTFPTVAVQFDGSLHDVSDEDLKRVEQKFINRMVGETRANKPLWLPPGVKVVPLTITPNQMVFGATAEETAENILALYRVPPICAGKMKGLTFGALRAAKAGLYDQAVNPERRFYASVLDEKVGPLYADNLRLWWEDAMPPDPEILENQLKTDLLYGARTANEVRAIRGLQPYDPVKVPWADDPVRPVNVETGTGPLGGDHNPSPAPTPDYDHPAINPDDTKDLPNTWDGFTNGLVKRHYLP